jgi:hypothetical protein
MPKSIRVDLAPRPSDLAAKPELAAHIGRITVAWSNVEQEMAAIFAYGMGSEPAISYAIMGCVANLATRLSMIRTALDLRASNNAGGAFWKAFEQRIRKKAKGRNLVAHAVWTTHPDYPECLIRTDGLLSPRLSAEAYDQADFLEIELDLVRLTRDLKEFAEALPRDHPPRDSSDQSAFWRPAGPHKVEVDAQDQPARTRPTKRPRSGPEKAGKS